MPILIISTRGRCVWIYYWVFENSLRTDTVVFLANRNKRRYICSEIEDVMSVSMYARIMTFSERELGIKNACTVPRKRIVLKMKGMFLREAFSF